MTTLTAAKPRHATGSGRSKLLALLAALASVFVLAACHFVGSGTVTSATGKGKATFTFDVKCPASGAASGVLTYADTPAGVSFHGVVPGSTANSNCSPSPTVTTVTLDGAAKQPNIIPFGDVITGSYTPLKPGAGGTFSLTVIPGGTSQSNPGFFCIALYGGVYDGYTNAGPVFLGNIVNVGP